MGPTAGTLATVLQKWAHASFCSRDRNGLQDRPPVHDATHFRKWKEQTGTNVSPQNVYNMPWLALARFSCEVFFLQQRFLCGYYFYYYYYLRFRVKSKLNLFKKTILLCTSFIVVLALGKDDKHKKKKYRKVWNEKDCVAGNMSIANMKI